VHEYYSASVAPIVQNSARLRTATPGTKRYERLTDDVIKDIEYYFYVSDERKAEIVREFNEAAREPKMLVCAFCGMRDPDMHYEELDLDSLPPDHWARVDASALHELDALPSASLLRRTLLWQRSAWTSHRP